MIMEKITHVIDKPLQQRDGTFNIYYEYKDLVKGIYRCKTLNYREEELALDKINRLKKTLWHDA